MSKTRTEIHTVSITETIPPVRWRIGTIEPKTNQPTPGPPGRPAPGSEFTVQLTADQQVALSITGQDRYGNPVDVTGGISWTSSDTSVVSVTPDGQNALAVAVGPVGTAAVTVSNDHNSDEEIDFQGSIAIDVVAGEIAEIEVTEGIITDKGAHADNSLPDVQP